MKRLIDFSHKKDTKAGKTISFILTAFVLGLLILAGPVDALNIGLSGFKDTPYSFGETINFIGKVKINSDERVNLKNISLEVNGNVVCVFDLNGNNLNSCQGVNLIITSNAPFGYGYGYNDFEAGWKGGDSSSNAGNYEGYSYGYGYGQSNGEILYNISIQTPQGYLNVPGNNDLKLIAQSENQLFNSRIERIVIQPQSSNNGGGSSSGGGGGGSNDERRNSRISSGQIINSTNLALLSTGDPATDDAAFEELKQNLLKNAQSGDSNGFGLISGNIMDKKFSLEEYLYATLILIVIAVTGFIVYKRRNRFVNKYA